MQMLTKKNENMRDSLELNSIDSNDSVQVNTKEIKKLRHEIELSKMNLQRGRTKRKGIRYGELNARDVKDSFKAGCNQDSDSEDTEEDNNDQIASLIIISQNNKLLMLFKTYITFLSLTSSYVYAFMAAFEKQSDN